jgi:hypothetical protein
MGAKESAAIKECKMRLNTLVLTPDLWNDEMPRALQHLVQKVYQHGKKVGARQKHRKVAAQ